MTFAAREGVVVLVVAENGMKPPHSHLQREGVVPSCRPHPHCTPFPPHEQLLVVAVGGAVMVVVLRSSLLSLIVIVARAGTGAGSRVGVRMHRVP